MSLVKLKILLNLLFLLGCNDSMDSYYSNYNEVKSDNAIGRGWVPEEIPKSSFEIKEWHNVDTNIGCGSFKFAKIDIEIFLEKLHPINNFNLRYKCFNIRTDWHKNQNINSLPKLTKEGFLMYKTGKFYFAVNTIKCQTYFWNIYSIKEV